MVAQGEPDERDHVKAEPDDEYFLSECGWTLLIGLRFGRFVFGRCAAQGGLLLWRVHLLGFYADVGAGQVVSEVPMGPMSLDKNRSPDAVAGSGLCIVAAYFCMTL